MFYFDDILKKYEEEHSWDKALTYLESLFVVCPRIEILNSLVGFSWLYLVEGPVISGKYGEDYSQLPLFYWKKYLSIGFTQYEDNSLFCFIAGYTLLLDGYIYLEEYRSADMPTGMRLLEQVIETGDGNIAAFAQSIVSMERGQKGKSCKVDKHIFNELFANGSLLEKVFYDCYV